MYHSIYIGDKNTWDDFHLVANNRPVVASPEVRTVYIDIPGVDGGLDLTTALTGSVLYKNREGSWDFTVINDYEEWELIWHRLMNTIHGQKTYIILEDDPGFYYIGRLTIDEWLSEKNNSKVTISYNLEPWKYEANTGENWVWNAFNFEYGVIRAYDNIPINGNTITVKIPGSKRPTIPSFTVGSHDVVMKYNNKTYNLSAGKNRFVDIVLGEEESTFVFTGGGTVSIDYKGGWL